MLRRLFGSEFQTARAAKWKERSLADLRLTRGDFNNLSVEDRSDRAGLYMQSVADRKDGNIPSKCRNARTAYLYWIWDSKGSQWRSYMMGWYDHTSSSSWLNEPCNFVFFALKIWYMDGYFFCWLATHIPGCQREKMTFEKNAITFSWYIKYVMLWLWSEKTCHMSHRAIVQKQNNLKIVMLFFVFY